MNKKAFTALFTIALTVLNIIMTLLIIVILAIVSSFILNRVLHVENGSVYMVVWMICFIVGMIANLLCFAKLTNVIITKFKLEDKLDPRYTGKKGAQNEKPKFKGNIPDSVKPPKDTWGYEETPKPEAEPITENPTYGEILDASTLGGD